jgi:hypothetical protein
LTFRIEAARSAQERTRLAYFASTVISLAIITTGWNAYLSFYRDFAFEFPSLEGGSGTENLQKEILSEWVKSRMINISLLGIRVGIDDAPILGGIALTIAVIWLFYSIRRENHTIGMMLTDYSIADDRIKWLIFHGVNSSTVFTNVSHGDEPFRALARPSNSKQRAVIRSMASAVIRSMAKLLRYLPIFSLGFIILADIFSMFCFSPFREPDVQKALVKIQENEDLRKQEQFSKLPDRPWTLLEPNERKKVAEILQGAGRIRGREPPWARMPFTERMDVVLNWIVSVIISLPLLVMCKLIADFADGTEAVLSLFYNSLPSYNSLP